MFFLLKANRHSPKDRTRDDPAFGNGKDSNPDLPCFHIISERTGIRWWHTHHSKSVSISEESPAHT